MRKVLVITYYWPPCSGSGVQRWMYFCKYLPDFGFQPIVVTVNESKASYRRLDPAFSEKVADVEVHKTNTLEPLKLYSLLTTGSAIEGIPQGHVGTGKQGLLNRLSNFVRSNFFVPDARVGWNRYAYQKAKRIIRDQGIDLIITTGPPQSTHLTGLRLKREFSLSWVADFRDPWTDIYYNKTLKRMGWADRKDNRMEKEVLEEADLVLTVGANMADLLAAKTSRGRTRIEHVYNGYDAEQMDKLKPPPLDHFEMTHIGLLSFNQPHLSVIRALNRAFPEPLAKPVTLTLAGHLEDSIIADFKNKLVGVTVKSLGYVPHATALRMMKQAQILISVLPDMEESRIMISGKMMEYIATGNPVLCFGDTQSEASLMLKELPNSDTFAYDDVEGPAHLIRNVYSLWEAGDLKPNDTGQIKNKSRYETAKRLASILNNLQGNVRSS